MIIESDENYDFNTIYEIINDASIVLASKDWESN